MEGGGAMQSRGGVKKVQPNEWGNRLITEKRERKGGGRRC